MSEVRFTARVIHGSHRGREHGVPTINLDLSDIPKVLKEGIYACIAEIDGQWEAGVMHYGPRPVFKDVPSCEVHLLKRTIFDRPVTLTVGVLNFIREIRDFANPEDLYIQIVRDIEDAHAILKSHGFGDSEAAHP